MLDHALARFGLSPYVAKLAEPLAWVPTFVGMSGYLGDDLGGQHTLFSRASSRTRPHPTPVFTPMDTLTPAPPSERKGRVKHKGSAAERLVRSLVHRMGYRFRLHRAGLPGRPDLVFPGRRKAIFVHGCFWHRHPDPDCKLARLPKSRHDFWVPKLEGNRARDGRVRAELETLGWGVLEVWECRLRDSAFLENEIRTFLES